MKIKWNWGTKLLIAMIFFMGLLVVLVILSTRQGIMLVEKDYYPKGLKYQERLDEISNADPLSSQVRVLQDKDNVVISLPEIVPDTGSIVFYRPSNNELDRIFFLKNEEMSVASFPKSSFVRGQYIIKLFWVQEGKGYYIEKPFYFN